ncbi:Chromatin modification-related protein [Dirofilaria immitis]
MEAEASSSNDSTANVIVKTEPASPIVPYEVNSMILCSHTDNLFYEAKIIAVKLQANGEYMYTVHYQGWSKRYDENIPHSKSASRFRSFTPDNIELAKIEMKEAKARAAMLVKRKKSQKTETRRGFPTAIQLSESSSNASRHVKLPVNHSVSEDNSSEGLSGSSSTSEAVSIPGKLKALLENDRHLVENELKLPCLPCRLTVSKIMKEYVTHVRKLDAVCSEVKVHKGRARYWKGVVAALDECVDNVESFFNLVLTSDILYQNEKLRHKDLIEGTSGVIHHTVSDFLNEPKKGLRASEYYGFIYLLRLLIRFPEMIECMLCDSDSKEILSVFVQSFVRYLGSNSEKFFDPELDYEPITHEYKLRLLQNSNV